MQFAYSTKGVGAVFAYNTTLLLLFTTSEASQFASFAVASNGEVSFSMTVSRLRLVQHRLWRFTFV